MNSSPPLPSVSVQQRKRTRQQHALTSFSPPPLSLPHLRITRPSLRRQEQENTYSFGVTLCKVGWTLAILFLGVSTLFRYQRIVLMTNQGTDGHVLQGVDLRQPPPFRLDTGSNENEDAYGIAQEYRLDQTDYQAAANPKIWKEMVKLHREFENLYGLQVRTLLQRALSGNRPHLLAGRMRQRLLAEEDFSILVMGGSAPASYGNQFQQAYSQVLPVVLTDVFQIVGISLSVQSLAMHHLTEFPSTWCLDHYIQRTTTTSPDLIVWDFARTPLDRLEAWIRYMGVHYGQSQFVFRNVTPDQGRLVQHYAKAKVLLDPILLHEDYAVQELLQQPPQQRPIGLQDWEIFGAPGGGPDKIHHSHLSVQRHEWVAWILSMQVLASLEIVHVHADEKTNLALTKKPSILLPEPYYLQALTNATLWGKLLLDPTAYPHLDCYTAFDVGPRSGDTMERINDQSAVPSNLHDLIHPTTTMSSDTEWLLPKTAMHYTGSWVYDLDLEARRQKLRTKGIDFLGMPDWKAAYYGVSVSGPLTLQIPDTRHTNSTSKNVLLCASDALETESSCVLHRDCSVSIQDSGGNAKQVTMRSVATDVVATLEKKRLCAVVQLPADATQFSLQVTSDQVTWKGGPCSLAHVLVGPE